MVDAMFFSFGGLVFHKWSCFFSAIKTFEHIFLVSVVLARWPICHLTSDLIQTEDDDMFDLSETCLKLCHP